ncbi:MAG: putative nucleic acid-binding Zn ribbon protein, partial [Candidatus Krumholzibacteriia bacterium]
PECRGKVERLISGGLGVHFKGAGFYVNDSRSKSTEKSSTSEKSAAKNTSKPQKSDS